MVLLGGHTLASFVAAGTAQPTGDACCALRVLIGHTMTAPVDDAATFLRAEFGAMLVLREDAVRVGGDDERVEIGCGWMVEHATLLEDAGTSAQRARPRTAGQGWPPPVCLRVACVCAAVARGWLPTRRSPLPPASWLNGLSARLVVLRHRRHALPNEANARAPPILGVSSSTRSRCTGLRPPDRGCLRPAVSSGK